MRDAGYRSVSHVVETDIRSVGLNANFTEEAVRDMFNRIHEATGGVVLSDEEVMMFVEGTPLKELLEARFKYQGDVTIPADSGSETVCLTDQNATARVDEHDGRETAYCLSCQRVRPIVYGYSQRPTMAATIDLGGPVNPTRILSETTEETFCAVCNRRVYTEAEGKRLEEKEQEEKATWILLGVMAFIVIIAIGLMMLSVANK